MCQKREESGKSEKVILLLLVKRLSLLYAGLRYLEWERSGARFRDI